MRLLVYEHISAGGFERKPVQPGVLSEGFGMLRTLIEDMKKAGHSVTTVLNSRLAAMNPPLKADRRICARYSAKTESAIEKSLERNEAAYIIAPETDGILWKLVEKIERSGLLSLNSSAKTITEVSDKRLNQRHIKRIGLPTPQTVWLRVDANKKDASHIILDKIGFPVVIKPSDGASCEGLSIADNEKQMEQAIIKVAHRGSSHFVAQPLIKGTPVSVTLISNGEEALPVTLNMQTVSLKDPSRDSSYNGGATPLDDGNKQLVYATAKKVVESFKGLKGYIGVDLILKEKSEPVVLEVNPRLTTSYIGIRKIMRANVAQAIITSVVKQEIPRDLETSGYAYFEKVLISNPSEVALRKFYNIPELVSPPFPSAELSHTCALICTKGLTVQQAKCRFQRARRHLQDICLYGGKNER